MREKLKVLMPFYMQLYAGWPAIFIVGESMAVYLIVFIFTFVWFLGLMSLYSDIRQSSLASYPYVQAEGGLAVTYTAMAFIGFLPYLYVYSQPASLILLSMLAATGYLFVKLEMGN